MSKMARAARKAAKSEEKFMKSDILLNFKIDQKFHLNDHHKAFVEKAFDEKNHIIFADGPAGSSKTYLAVYIALTLLKERKADEIVYIRSIVESASRKLGSLPGEVDEKFKPWSIPLVEKCDELVGKQITNVLFDNEYLKCIPVNFLRGATFSNNVVIVDEAQNLDHNELVTILTRFGKGCKLFIIGDSLQSDIPKSGFQNFIKAFSSIDSKDHGIDCFHFTEEDITRSKLLKYIVSVVKTIKHPN